MWRGSSETFEVCLIKRIFKIPCPSCGTTRAIEVLLNGDLWMSVCYNPLGLIVLPLMLIVPLWILYDYKTKRTSFYKFYCYIETLFKKPIIYAPSILLILLLWIWNIYKII
jgi:hypothetical protein